MSLRATSPDIAWRSPGLLATPMQRRIAIMGGLGYACLAVATVEVDITRALEGAERARELFGGLLRPNFSERYVDIRAGLLESAAMACVATVAGVALSVPLAVGASRQLVPRYVYAACRGALGLARAFHEIIVAILCVAMFGFGPFAGVVTLTVGSIGFVGKLLAEAIEEIDMGVWDAHTTHGSTWAQRVAYGVFPQVWPRLAGLALYRLDINFRASAIIGIVGAGGIGATLTTAFARYEFDTVSAILVLIVVIVFVTEWWSGRIRHRWIT